MRRLKISHVFAVICDPQVQRAGKQFLTAGANLAATGTTVWHTTRRI